MLSWILSCVEQLNRSSFFEFKSSVVLLKVSCVVVDCFIERRKRTKRLPVFYSTQLLQLKVLYCPSYESALMDPPIHAVILPGLTLWKESQLLWVLQTQGSSHASDIPFWSASLQLLVLTGFLFLFQGGRNFGGGSNILLKGLTALRTS